MYIGGGISIVIILLSILLMIGVIGLSNLLVGGLFLLVALGIAGPLFVNRV